MANSSLLSSTSLTLALLGSLILSLSSTAIASDFKKIKQTTNHKNLPTQKALNNQDEWLVQNSPTSTEINETSEATQSEQSNTEMLVVEIVVNGVEGELKKLVYETIDTKVEEMVNLSQLRAKLQKDVDKVYNTGFFKLTSKCIYPIWYFSLNLKRTKIMVK